MIILVRRVDPAQPDALLAVSVIPLQVLAITAMAVWERPHGLRVSTTTLHVVQAVAPQHVLTALRHAAAVAVAR